MAALFKRVRRAVRNVFGSPKKKKASVKKLKSGASFKNSERNQFKTTPNEAFSKKLIEQAGLNPNLQSGRLKVIGLEDVKAFYGSNWGKIKGLVGQIVSKAIANTITPADLFTYYPENDSYLILFSKASDAEAQIIVTLINEKIKHWLIEEMSDVAEKLTLDSVTTEIDNDKIKKSDNVLAALDAQLEEKTKTQHAKSTGEAQGDKAENTEPKRTAVLKYAPFWHVEKNAISSYMCVPAQASVKGNFPLDDYERFFVGATDSKKKAFDTALLQRVLDDMLALKKQNKYAFFFCPVHINTVTHQESSKAYKELCDKIPVELRRFLIFILLDVPKGVPERTLRFPCMLLQGYSKAVYIQLGFHSKADMITARDLGVTGVGTRITPRMNADKKMFDKLESFANTATSLGFNNIFLIGASSLSITTSSVCSGFSHLCGEAIHDCIERPDSVYKFKYEDIFADLLKE